LRPHIRLPSPLGRMRERPLSRAQQAADPRGARARIAARWPRSRDRP